MEKHVSIKKQGDMSDQLALGIRSQVERLAEWLAGFETLITNLQGIERKEVTQELRAEILRPIGSFLDSLETFEEGGEYEALDQDYEELDQEED
jgi:hypothetical protein